jgi:tRNA threonylcarbamoyladenosine biosynthesis protein TsaE
MGNCQSGTGAARSATSGTGAARSATGGTAELATAEDTVALGARLGAELRAGDVVVLSGPLGAGKTVLAKGIAEAMDVEGPVISPTFVLARVHRARRAGAPAMIHVDMYRLLDHASVDLLSELDSLDLDTDLDDAVVVVEWGEGLAERLSESHLGVRLERGRDTEVRTAIWQWSRP